MIEFRFHSPALRIILGSLVISPQISLFIQFLCVKPFPPTPPFRLQAHPGDRRVILTWMHPEKNNPKFSKWEYRQKREGEKEYRTVKINDREITKKSVDDLIVHETIIHRVMNGFIYVFQLRPIENQDPGRWSNEVMVTLGSTEKALLKGIKMNTANVVANTSDILAEVRNHIKFQDDFCKNKKFLGTVRFGCNSSCVTEKRMSKTLVHKLKNLDEHALVLVEGYASHDGDVLHNLKLSEERATEVINYLRCRYCKDVSRIRFRPLAKGEDHPEAEPNQKNCCDRQVRLFLCGSALSSTSNAPAEAPDCVCEDAECKSDLDDDSPCAEVDSACAEYENSDCQRQNRI